MIATERVSRRGINSVRGTQVVLFARSILLSADGAVTFAASIVAAGVIAGPGSLSAYSRGTTLVNVIPDRVLRLVLSSHHGFASISAKHSFQT